MFKRVQFADYEFFIPARSVSTKNHYANCKLPQSVCKRKCMHASSYRWVCELAYFYWSAGARVFKVPLLYLSDVRSRYPACVSLLPIREALPSCFVFIISLRWIFILRSNCTLFTLLICCITSKLRELGMIYSVFLRKKFHDATNRTVTVIIWVKFLSDLLELKTFRNQGEIKFVYKISTAGRYFMQPYSRTSFCVIAVIGNQRREIPKLEK